MSTPRVIDARKGWGFPDFREVRDYGNLVKMLIRRDIRVRYRQTSVGVLWAILQPMGLAAVFALFLGALAKVPSRGDIPYPLYVFSGLALWIYFQQAFSRSSESTLESSHMISKVYFPRIIIPFVAVITPVADILAAFLVLLGVMALYGYVPGPEILLTPVAVLLAVATALGLGLWTSALHVRFRDIHYLVPFLTLVGMFVSPVTYPFELVPDHLQPLYALNPLVGVLEVWRFALFGQFTGDWWIVLIPVVMSVVLLVTGALYFNRAERSFADLL